MLLIESLSAGYNGAPVLRDFSLRAGAGQIAAVIGPNGCGKSTLLRALAGLLKPHSGRITLNGDEVFQMEPRRRARCIALLPQSFEGGQNLTVEEMALLGRTPHLPPYGKPAPRDLDIVHKALQATGVGALKTRRIGELSGGERQRAMLARALCQEPQLLLLDEPVSNLDIRYQFEILSLVHQLARREKLIAVLVLHQINLAAALADVMVLLNSDGTPRAAGSPCDVMTAAHLEAVYQTPLRVAPHPKSGRPQAQAAWTFE